jgi:hypothetical protein
MKSRLALLITTFCPLFAQNVALPIAMGYTEPAPFQAAPGQVVTLFLDDISFGADGGFRSAQAGAGDLPQRLAGISVRITKLDGSEMQAPIFAVQQKPLCGLSGLQAGDAGCLLTLVKVQIPFELPGDLVLDSQKIYTLPLPALISIDVDGRISALLRSRPDRPYRRNRPPIARCSRDYRPDTEYPASDAWNRDELRKCAEFRATDRIQPRVQRHTAPDHSRFALFGPGRDLQGEFHAAYPQGPDHSVRR